MRRALAALALACAAACGGGADAARVAMMEAYLDRQVEANDFSGSVLVAVGGEVLFSRGCGLANREHGIPCAPETKYRLGSLTKPITAVAMLQLVERGLVDLHAPVERYVRDLPAHWRGMTLHHMLTHQTGLPHDPRLAERDVLSKLPTRPRATMHLFADCELAFPPGEGFLYTNGGFMLAAVVLEDVTGERWEDWLRANVFGPAGMEDSGHDTHAAVLPHRASGYRLKGGAVEHADYYDMDFAIGGGDLYSTTGDLLRLARALRDDTLLSAASRAEMFRPQAEDYGYGWRIGGQFGRPRAAHGGGINGFEAQLSLFLEDDVTIAVLCNNEWSAPETIARNLASIVFEGTYQGAERDGGGR